MSELIEEINEMLTSEKAISLVDKDFLKACKEALQQSQWVSVEDEVPEIGQSFDAWHDCDGRFPDHGPYVGHGWDKQSIKESLLIHSFTHWRLQPAPPPAKEQAK